MDLEQYSDSQLVRPDDLAKYLTISRRQIDRLCASNKFPKKVRLGPKSVAFRVGDIRKWLADGGWKAG
jgi:predicted DNA-binding transcriptional regulator AlpA